MPRPGGRGIIHQAVFILSGVRLRSAKDAVEDAAGAVAPVAAVAVIAVSVPAVASVALLVTAHEAAAVSLLVCVPVAVGWFVGVGSVPVVVRASAVVGRVVV